MNNAGKLNFNLVTVMLVTSLFWWLYDGDWFENLMTKSFCWQLCSLCWWFPQWMKSITNISNLSPTHLVSNIRQQHRCNPQMFNRINRCFRRLKLLKMNCIFSPEWPFVDTSSPLWDLRRQNLHQLYHLKSFIVSYCIFWCNISI